MRFTGSLTVRMFARLTIIGMWVVVASTSAFAADFEEYSRLVQSAQDAHEQLDGASPELLDALRRNALARDLAVISWLDGFFEDPEFQSLPAEQQALAYQDRYRNEFNASRLLIELGECEQARDRLRTLLDSAVNDDELRPLLTGTYEEAVTCVTAAAPQPSRITVRCQPASAEVSVDGVAIGLCSGWHDVEPGAHQLTVAADGYVAANESFQLDSGQDLELGPFTLEQAVVVDPDPELDPQPTSAGKSPSGVHWALWGTGLAGVGTGVVLLLSAADLQDGIDNPPAGQQLVDEQAEQDKVDRRQLFGYVAAGVGLAAAITGTILYLTADGPVSTDTAWSFEPSPQGLGGMLRVRF